MAQINLGHVVGPGVPTGGTTGQILKKNSSTNFDDSWGDLNAGTIPMSGSDSTSIGNKISQIDQGFGSIADEYDSTSTYAVGERCLHEGGMYRCTTAIAVAEAWDSDHWTAVTVADELAAEATARSSADLTMSQAIGVLEDDIAAEYSSSATYAIGDRCLHNGSLYRCSTAITTAEAWTSGHWTATDIDTELAARETADAALSQAVGVLEDDIAPEYSSSATYAVGDRCLHDGSLYRCSTAITTAEAWTSGHWTATDIDTELAAEASARATADTALDQAIGVLEGDIAPEYSSSATYAVGDRCLHDGSLYRCSTEISTAEAWTSGHWTATSVDGELKTVATSVGTEATARAAADSAISTELAKDETALAIVVNGNTAPRAITSGQYLFIKNHSTLTSGGYHATANIANGDTISSSNVTADADGIANALNDKFMSFPGINIGKAIYVSPISKNGGVATFSGLQADWVYILLIGTDNPYAWRYAGVLFPGSQGQQMTAIVSSHVTITVSSTGFTIRNDDANYPMSARIIVYGYRADLITLVSRT